MPPGLKPKDLVGIPWLVAFALRADGWFLRSDVIWSKPNPMPESVTDRPTKSHEYLFLLSKAESYFYDGAAIAEPASLNKPWSSSSNGGQKAALVRGDGYRSTSLGKPRWNEAEANGETGATRNRRTVWTITSEPFPEAHFAVMPQALAEPCLLAGSRPGDTVLDPFAGSGTVGVVALRHGRDFVGIDLSAEYCAMAAGRIAGPLFANDGNEPATKPAEQPQLFEQST
jgi:DNA modification methylase